MGVGIGGKDISFNAIDDLQDKESHGLDQDIAELLANNPDYDVNIDFRSSTVVDAEGAYFFNKYVGVGGRFRVRAMSAKSFGKYANITNEDANAAWIDTGLPCINDIYRNANDVNWNGTSEHPLTPALINQGGAPVTNMEGIVKSDHLAEFTGSIGLYLNLPLSSRFSLGTKLLIGRSMTQDLDIDGYAEGNVKDINYGMIIENSKVSYLYAETPTSTGEKWTDEWDYLTLSSTNGTSYGTGLSLTYRYKSNFSWRLFCDYDYSQKTFTLTNDSYHFLKASLTDNAYSLIANRSEMQDGSPLSYLAYDLNPSVYKKKKKMNFFTIGLSFMVNL
jgi:hypothetical protein